VLICYADVHLAFCLYSSLFTVNGIWRFVCGPRTICVDILLNTPRIYVRKLRHGERRRHFRHYLFS